jgi:hypothetical protein
MCANFLNVSRFGIGMNVDVDDDDDAYKNLE